MKEIEIKVHLINWLLDDRPYGTLIGSEVRFDFGSRRVDVITLNGNIACAYEIKGIGDSLKRLSHQVDGYKKYFDECYIV
ncbi:sce7726 family protein [Dickeya sp. NCPPB 3274]|uniref:sce7726 family protein n=1 Tax=Dickeya sp. NCPPB 3274 TaxID=568766 RepID=UPI0012685356|nr:sce7726 family protein [Dickeya sp. NCPPB 3274]